MDRPTENGSVPRMPLSKQEKMKEFWRKIEEDIEDCGERALPVSRIKKIIRDKIKGTMMMTCDTPSFVTKACEIFVQELTFRAWMCAESHQRRVILDSDIAEAISSTESYGFLNDVLRAYREVHNSAPHTEPTTKKHYRFLLNQPSSSHPPPYVQASFVSMSQNNIHPSPLAAFPFQLQHGCSLRETSATPTLNSTGTVPPPTNFASSAMNLTQQTYSGSVPEIPNTSTCYKNTVMSPNASTAPYGVVDASIDDVSTHKGGVGVVIESNPIIPRVVETGNTHGGGIDLDTTICVEEGQHQQQEEETTKSEHLVDGNLEGMVVANTNSSGSINNINLDEFGNESWWYELWNNFMVEDPAPWLHPASTSVPQNLGESSDSESYHLHEIDSDASNNNNKEKQNEPKK